MEIKTDLSKYDNSWYNPGAGVAKRTLWYFLNLFFLKSGMFPYSNFIIVLLRLFGAKIGTGVIIKPGINIKYPWFLKIDEYTWIGEDVWIDNLALVEIGKGCCISQGAMLLTGNHNYSMEAFDLMVKSITLKDGVWIGAKALVAPGVICNSHSVLSAGSVLSTDMEPYSIYKGNPAVKFKKRIMNSVVKSE